MCQPQPQYAQSSRLGPNLNQCCLTWLMLRLRLSQLNIAHTNERLEALILLICQYSKYGVRFSLVCLKQGFKAYVYMIWIVLFFIYVTQSILKSLIDKIDTILGSRRWV